MDFCVQKSAKFYTKEKGNPEFYMEASVQHLQEEKSEYLVGWQNLREGEALEMLGRHLSNL